MSTPAHGKSKDERKKIKNAGKKNANMERQVVVV